MIQFINISHRREAKLADMTSVTKCRSLDDKHVVKVLRQEKTLQFSEIS